MCFSRWRFNSNLPTRPLPSLNGWIDSNRLWSQTPSRMASSLSVSFRSYSSSISSISLATFSKRGGVCLDPLILTLIRLQLPASDFTPLNTASCSSRIVTRRTGLDLRLIRSRKTISCWMVSSMSLTGLPPTPFSSSRSRSTSCQVSVFPSIAFVPHVFNALVCFQTRSGRSSNGARVSSDSRSESNMLFLIITY